MKKNRITLKQFVLEFIEPNSLIRLWYENGTNYQMVIDGGVCMEHEIIKETGIYKDYINHEFRGIPSILVNGHYSEAINIVISNTPTSNEMENKVKYELSTKINKANLELSFVKHIETKHIITKEVIAKLITPLDSYENNPINPPILIKPIVIPNTIASKFEERFKKAYKEDTSTEEIIQVLGYYANKIEKEIKAYEKFVDNIK